LLRRLLALFILLALVGAGFFLWKGSSAGFKIKGFESVSDGFEDAKTTASVKAAFGLNRSLKPHRIQVSSEHGVVTLRGDVPDETIKASAGRVAAAVPDVRQVVNHLEISPGAVPATASDLTLGESLDDRALEVQVKLALSLHRELRDVGIAASAYRRHLTLSGQVERAEQKRAALEIARQAAGVLEVIDRIEVSASSESAVDEPATSPRMAIEKALRANENLAVYRLEVREEKGRLVLRGRVRTGAERDLASALAREATRKPVENGLEIQL
jgi:hyperosmotically inducible periplasmic protein